MFGFLIASEVNDDAVKLKTFTDMTVSKCLNLTKLDLEAIILKDFLEDRRNFERFMHLSVIQNYISFYSQ